MEAQIATKQSPTVTDATKLIDELGLDSVSMLELITCVEERFDITIDFDEFDIETLNVAGSLASLIQGKLSHKPGVPC